MMDEHEPDPVLVAPEPFHDAVDAVAGQAEDGVDAPVRQSLDEHFRRDCRSCRLRFRTKIDETGSFPATPARAPGNRRGRQFSPGRLRVKLPGACCPVRRRGLGRRVHPGLDDSRRSSPKALRDYAFIADGRRGALIDCDGRLAWMCFPRWSDPAVVAGLLGAGGEYRVSPEGRCVPGGLYEDGTLIWHSRWVTEDGFRTPARPWSYPGEADRAIVLRRVTAVDAPCRVLVGLELAGDYGREPLSRWHRQGDRWVSGDGNDRGPMVGGAATRSSTHVGGAETLVLRTTLAAGAMPGPRSRGHVGFVRSSRPSRPRRMLEPHRGDLATMLFPPAPTMPAGADVRRSFAVLRGMTGPEGATVAAATTSLPERSEAGRNYDYRYCWVRDICYIGHAGAAVEGERLSSTTPSAGWRRDCWPMAATLSPAYLPEGEPIPDEKPLDLPGYPGASTSSGTASEPSSNSTLFGEALLLLATAAARDRLDVDGGEPRSSPSPPSSECWNEPDAGSGRPSRRGWTHSRLICVAGLRAIGGTDVPDAAGRPSAVTLADHLLSETDRTSLHPSGRWQRAPDDDRVDASLLLAEIRGALAADDPRSRATRRADRRRAGRRRLPLPLRGIRGTLWARPKGPSSSATSGWRWPVPAPMTPPSAARWFERGRSACGSPGHLCRGVRRRAAPAARQFSPGLRACPAHRIRR